MEFKDYYATLGLDKKASAADIKRAYRRLARKHHPDLNPGDKAAEQKFKDINEANEVLGDPEKRRKYDELGANWRQYEQAEAAGRGGGRGAPGQGPFGGGFPGGGSYLTMTPEEAAEMFGGGGDDPFSDFFHTFFGGGFGGGGAQQTTDRRPRRGQDVEHPVDLTLEEVFNGTSRRLRLAHEGGTDRTVEVRIPAGVSDGARVRAAGEGGAGARGGTRGDLFLRVRTQPHARFERRGQDLHVRVSVPITTAVLGGEVAVPTLSGSTLRLKVPEMTGSGRVFRLRGHGLPTVGKPDERGDLYATVDLQIPQSLSQDARE